MKLYKIETIPGYEIKFRIFNFNTTTKAKMYFIEIVLNFIFFIAGLEPGAFWMPGKYSTSELHRILDSEFGSFLSRLVICNPVLALDVRQIQKAALQRAKVTNTSGHWVTHLGEGW